MTFDGLEGVGGAAGMKAARAGKIGGHNETVGTDKKEEGASHHGTDHRSSRGRGGRARRMTPTRFITRSISSTTSRKGFRAASRRAWKTSRTPSRLTSHSSLRYASRSRRLA